MSGPSRRSALAGLLLAAGLLAGVACSPAPAPRPLPPVTVFAAASLTDALGELASVYAARTGQVVRLSFAASGQVARQVEAGAPADIVILADRPWMDRLAASGRIAPGSRLGLLGNRLVLVAAPDARIEGEPLDWLKRTGGKLVIGDPDSVPAGAYARDWLKKAGRWDELQSSLVTAADVRAVRSFVARGEAQLGVVYRSDATGFAGVRVVQEPPPAEQPEIVYPAALTPMASPAAPAFLRWLRTSEAGAVFRRHGFEPLS
ncbi:molybdate ABC transporter substrate-binding protein [Brevundimonas goettingensis]|uniref:Molybdate ABC transporter substrate-binding protein n=1 Tax=Brevundimonas goettingensis TaxID=2774190 RepID=A0A975C3B4_9CAUL|nr:molybdate ABC transporter substrate-binding protein [Brevundimonas goettingensis]QTC91095.1 molybdate ABC transporter substrate-binding protein [Brevundimonas goettingensis]